MVFFVEDGGGLGGAAVEGLGFAVSGVEIGHGMLEGADGAYGLEEVLLFVGR